MVATGRYLVNKWGIPIPVLALVTLLAAMAVLFSTQSTWAQEADEPPCSGEDLLECSYDEKGTDPIVEFSSRDPEGNRIEFTVRGADSADFSVVGGVLRFKESPNYETPSDRVRTDDDTTADVDESAVADDNVYEIVVRSTEVRAADAEGAALFTELPVTVTVGNVNEDGEAEIDLRQPEVGQGLASSLTDPDGASGGRPPVTDTAITSGITYLWSVPKSSRADTDNDDHWQPANPSTDAAAYTPVLDDVGKFLRVKMTYADGEGSDKVAYAKTEYKVRAEVAEGDNADPTFPTDTTTREVSEDAEAGDPVGAVVMATDANSDTLTYSLTSTGDGDEFGIDKKTGQIRVTADTNIDADVTDNAEKTVTVTATDPSGATDTIVVTITVTGVDEEPVVKGDNDETDPTTEFKVVEGDSKLLSSTDTETMYTASDEDADDEFRLDLAGDDADDFELKDEDDDDVYVLTFKDSPNYESPTDMNGDNLYKVTVMAVSTNTGGLTGEQAVTVEVSNIEEAGKVTLSSIQPQVGVPLTATLSDPDGDTTGEEWQWSRAQTDASGTTFMEIEGATSATYTPEGDDPATEDQTEGDVGYFLRVVVTYNDPQMPDDPETTGDDMVEGQRTIGAVDDDDSPTSENAVRKPPETNDAPEFAKASYTREVDENTGEEGKVGEPVMATDGDEDVLTYSLSGGADKDAFEIDNKGQITVGAGTELDYESSKKSYMVVVKAEDPFGESDTARVTITVMDVNEKPTLGLLPAQALIIAGQSSVNYEETDDAVVETYTADGAAEGATVTWTLSGDDADDFDISSGGELTFMALPDFEDATDADTDNVYEVTIEATDGTNADTHDVTVTVTDVEELGTGTVVERYDTDDNDEISGSEVIQAVRDYFAGDITGPQVIMVVRAYFTSRQVN